MATEAVYQIFKDKASKYRYRLLSKGNHEVILQATKGHTYKSDCKSEIGEVKVNSPYDSRYNKGKSSDGQYFFNLVNAQGNILGRSETYRSASGRDNGINAVQRDAPGAPIDDLT